MLKKESTLLKYTNIYYNANQGPIVRRPISA